MKKEYHIGYRMNKKGIFLPLMVIFTLMLFSWAYYALGFVDLEEKKIGENQNKLYQIYDRGEKTRLYVEEASRLAAYHAIMELAENGGYKEGQISECNNVGFNVWWNNEKDCVPADLELKFKELYRKHLNNDLRALDAIQFELYNLVDSYNIEFTFGEELSIDGSGNDKYLMEDDNIDYLVNLNFKHAIEYNFADYNEIKVIMIEPLRLCETAECFNRVIKKGDYQWKIVDKQDFVLFEVNTGKKVFNDDVVIKFAAKSKS